MSPASLMSGPASTFPHHLPINLSASLKILISFIPLKANQGGGKKPTGLSSGATNRNWSKKSCLPLIVPRGVPHLNLSTWRVKSQEGTEIVSPLKKHYAKRGEEETVAKTAEPKQTRTRIEDDAYAESNSGRADFGQA